MKTLKRKVILVAALSVAASALVGFLQVYAQSSSSDPEIAQQANESTQKGADSTHAMDADKSTQSDDEANLASEDSSETMDEATQIEGEAAAEPADASASVAESETDRVLEALLVNLPGIAFTDASKSDIPGLYEVLTDGQVYYVDETAEYLIDGSLIRLSDRTNLTDARLGKMHMTLIASMDEQEMLIYEPDTASDRAITVFTDISCGYCRRLHAELDTLLEEGVRVRYLLFPRAGLGSQGHKDLESVWCADNPQEAMTNAKAGGEIEPKTCDNPIEKHVALAESVGLQGTPLIYTDGGIKVPGYREAAVLAEMVNDSERLSE